MNLDQYEWSPTMIAFDSNPDNTAKSTSWHVYNVSTSIISKTYPATITNKPS